MQVTQGIFFKDFSNAYVPNILTEIYTDKIYDPFLKGKKDLTIIDLGANIGLWTFYAQDKAKVVYSVEPAAQHFDTLQTMLAYNNFSNVVPINKAISHENGTATFHHSRNSTMFTLKDNLGEMDNGESETVETITIDKLFDDYKIDHVDFIKMDVEGEEPFLIGSAGFAKVAPKIDMIVGEVHVWSGVNPEQTMATLRDYGFETNWIEKNKVALFSAVRK